MFPAVWVYTVTVKSLQSCPTPCNPRDGSPPGFPVPGILQARTLEWVAISFSNAWKWKVKVKSLSRVWLSHPMDCGPPGSSIHGICQARILEWGAIAFSLYTSEMDSTWASQVALVVKNPSASAGDASSIPGSARSPGEGNGNPLQDSCLGNLMDSGAWQATVHGVTKNQTRLSTRAESSSLQTVSSAVAWDRGGSRLPTFTLSPAALLVYVLYNGLQSK